MSCIYKASFLLSATRTDIHTKQTVMHLQVKFSVIGYPNRYPYKIDRVMYLQAEFSVTCIGCPNRYHNKTDCVMYMYLHNKFSSTGNPNRYPQSRLPQYICKVSALCHEKRTMYVAPQICHTFADMVNRYIFRGSNSFPSPFSLNREQY